MERCILLNKEDIYLKEHFISLIMPVISKEPSSMHVETPRSLISLDKAEFILLSHIDSLEVLHQHAVHMLCSEILNSKGRGIKMFSTTENTYMTHPSNMLHTLPHSGQLGLEPYHSSSRSIMGCTQIPGQEHSGQGLMGQSCLVG